MIDIDSIEPCRPFKWELLGLCQNTALRSVHVSTSLTTMLSRMLNRVIPVGKAVIHDCSYCLPLCIVSTDDYAIILPNIVAQRGRPYRYLLI